MHGLAARPAYGGVALATALLVAVPPSAWASFNTPPGQGTYRRWIWEDPLGSGVHITDEAGSPVQQRAFEPFGEVARERSSEPTRQTFATHDFESALGLYYMKARWYDPTTGRFLSTDPLIRDVAAPQSINAYSYAENDPLNRIDPTGLFSFSQLLGDLINGIGGGFSFGFSFGDFFGGIFGGIQQVGTGFFSEPGLPTFDGGIGVTADGTYVFINVLDPSGLQEDADSVSANLDDLQTALGIAAAALDLTGVGAPLGAALDITNGIISLTRGDYTGAIASTLAIIPGVGTVLGAGYRAAKAGDSVLDDISRAAFQAADDVDTFIPKNKHLLGGGSQSKARFASSDVGEVRGIVQEALRSPNALFLPNPNLPDTFRVVTDVGRVIGVKGQTAVRAIVGLDGKVINAFPVHTR